MLLVIGNKLLLTSHAVLRKAIPFIIENFMPFPLTFTLGPAKLLGAHRRVFAGEGWPLVFGHVGNGDRLAQFRGGGIA
jgi:hypothetical protein